MQSETLAQEFARLVKEYHEGDERTKPEAWNLLADYAVDNADAISAALSAEQTQPVAVKALEGWELVPKSAIMWLIGAGPDAYGNWFEKPEGAPAFWWRTHFNKLRADAAKLRSALVDVPEKPEPSAFRVRVPGWGEELLFTKDGAKELIARIRSAKGVQGVATITPLYTSPPLSREGEDTAEVERLRALLDVALEALDTYADPTGYTDSNGEQLSSDDEVHQGLHAKQTAINLRAALAATRSGSATIAKGVSNGGN